MATYQRFGTNITAREDLKKRGSSLLNFVTAPFKNIPNAISTIGSGLSSLRPSTSDMKTRSTLAVQPTQSDISRSKLTGSSPYSTLGPPTPTNLPRISPPAPVQAPRPVQQAPVAPQVASGGFQAQLNPMDPAAIGGSMMQKFQPLPQTPSSMPLGVPDSMPKLRDTLLARPQGNKNGWTGMSLMSNPPQYVYKRPDGTTENISQEEHQRRQGSAPGFNGGAGEQDTFDYGGSVYRTNPDGSAVKVSGNGPSTLSRETALGGGTGFTNPGSTGLPTAPGQTDSMTAYEKAILDAMKPRESETTLQQQLAGLSEEQAKIQELEQKDLGAIRDRSTLLPFLTGQSSRLQQNVQGMLQGVAARALPLKERLAMEQAQRQAAISSAETARGFEKDRRDAEIAAKKEEREANKPIEVGGSLINPQTGEILFTAPSKEDLPALAQEFQFAQQNGYTGGFLDFIQAKKASESGSSGSRVLSPSEAQALGVPYGTTQEQAYGRSATNKPTVEQSKARQFAVAAENANQVLGTIGYDPGWVENPWVPNVFKGEARQQFEQAARAFVNATLRRESGATITDDEFKNKYLELIDRAGDSAAVKQQKAAARIAAVQSIKEAGGDQVMPSDDEINSFLDSFSGGSSVPQNAQAQRVANAIGQFESGGNYKSLGPVLTSGSYAGDRAYGKYQVMGKNVPNWTKEALGKSMTPQQFLADQKAQDAVAEYRMGKLLAQGYGVQDIASIWFSGQPLANAGNKKDQLGTSVPQYVKNVESIYNRMG